MGQRQTERLEEVTELSSAISGILVICTTSVRSVCVCVYVFSQIAGLKTNKEFVACLAGHPSFQQADVHTGFIPVRPILEQNYLYDIFFLLQQHQDTLFAARPALTSQQLALAALSLLCVEASHETANDTGT